MAIRMSRATGAWLTAGTWQTVSEVSSSYSNSEAASVVLTTSYVESTTSFTPGAVEVSGVAVKLSVRTGTTGTMTIRLADAGVTVSGTETVINTADLPVAATADLNGGWIFFEFAAPVTLPANALTLSCKTNTASMVSLFVSATNNWSRALALTAGTATPVAGDDVIICGEYTGAGTSNSFVVTMDETATTDYGAASTSLVTPAVAICSKGTLQYGTTASNAYYLKVSGNVIVYTGGTFNMGTSGTNMPPTSSGVLEFDCAANVDFGLTVRNLGTWNAYGNAAFTTTFKTLLNTDEAVAQTVLGMTATTGWANNDEICIASTTRTNTECEKRTISTVDSGTQVTVSAGLTNAHSGTSPTQAEVGNLTRNVKIRGIGTNAPSTSTTLQSYVDIKATATVTLRYLECYYLGSATANKRGIDVATTTGTFDMKYCSIHDCWITSSRGVNISSASGSGITFSNNVTFNVNDSHYQNVYTSGVHTIQNNLFMRNVVSSIVNLGDCGGILSSNNVIGASDRGIIITDFSTVINNLDDNTVHSCAGVGARFVSLFGTIANLTVWRNAQTGVIIESCNELKLTNLVAFGNTTANMYQSSSNFGLFNCVIIGMVSNSDTSFSTGNAIRFYASSGGTVILEDCDFSTASGIKTAHSEADVYFASPNSSVQMQLRNTKMGAATEVANQSNLAPGGYISSQKHDQTVGLHKTWMYSGTLTIDTTLFNTASPSARMTPTSASLKMASAPIYSGRGFKKKVASGATCAASIYVRKSATGSGDATSYNGNQPQLIVRRNTAAGISADTVLDTAAAAAGSWEQLTGTTAAVTDDAVLEFVVDCDGTVGFVNIDDFT
jgi:hypothetical protein